MRAQSCAATWRALAAAAEQPEGRLGLCAARLGSAGREGRSQFKRRRGRDDKWYSRGGDELQVGDANVVPAAVLLDTDGVPLHGRSVLVQDGRQRARAAQVHAVAHLGVQGRQLVPQVRLQRRTQNAGRVRQLNNKLDSP